MFDRYLKIPDTVYKVFNQMEQLHKSTEFCSKTKQV